MLQRSLSRRIFAVLLSSAAVWGSSTHVWATDSTAGVPYQFHNVKITAGGFITGFVAHPNAPGIVYARTDIGGAYRWNPNHGSWTPLTDFISPVTWDWSGTESIALDPTDPDRLYLAQGMYTESWSQNGGFLASTDRGAHFEQYSAPFQMGSNENGRDAGERLAVNPAKPNELYFGTRLNGLWKSEDYAKTWVQVNAFPIRSSADRIGIVFVVFDPKKPGVIFVGANQPNSIYKSTDDGATWALLPGQPTTFTKGQTGSQGPSPLQARLGANELYITYGDGPGPNGLNAGDVWVFNTSASTWTNITPPLDPFQSGPRGGFCGLSIDPNNPSLVAVATLDRWYPVDTVYVSKNGGGTWTSLGPVSSIPNTYGNWAFPASVTENSPWVTFGGANAKFGWWQAAVLIVPFSPDTLMYGTGATIFGTKDLSAAFSNTSPNWTVMAKGIEETAILTLISPTEGVNLLSGMGDIGGYRHEDFNTSPSQGMFTNPVFGTENGSDWAGLKPFDVARVGTTGNSTCQSGAYSTDQGQTWTPFPSCPTGLGAYSWTAGQIAISADGSRFVWSVGNNLGIAPQYSTDYGSTWMVSAGLPTNANVISDKQNANYFYGTDGSGGVWVSKDGGKTFAKTALLAGGNWALTANFAVAGDVWMGGSALYHSTDFGKTWVAVANPSLSYVNQLAIGAPPAAGHYQTLYMWGKVNNVQCVCRSTDGGATWVRVNDDQHQYGGNISVIAADSRIFGRYYLGTNGRGIIYADPQ